VPTYLVERYLPGRDRDWLVARLARLQQADGTVRYLGSIYIASDEACLCRFEATDAQDVNDVNALAGLPVSRIVPVTEFTPGAAGS